MLRTNRSRGNAPDALKKNHMTTVSKQPRRQPTSVSNLIPEDENNQVSGNAENLEAMLLSPTTTKRRVKSQERTPTGKQIVTLEKLNIESIATRENELNSAVNKISIDMNSNSITERVDDGNGSRAKKFKDVQVAVDMDNNRVRRSPTGRNLLKQLQTTLSPKLTEVNINEDRRVSRYGRHQKQKENINYVPGELMKFLGKTPPKIKPQRDSGQIVDELETDSLEFEIKKPKESENEDSKNNLLSFSKDPPVESGSSGTLSVLHDRSEDVLGMDAIKILGMNVSFENVNGNILFLEKTLQKKSIDYNHASDVDSAKGSSVDMEVEYRPGQIYWAAQNMKTVHWPCIVRVDPETDQVTRKHPQKMLEVHVAFFGDRGRRGWIREAYLIPFKGLENYRICAENMQFGKAVKKGIKPATMRKSWKHASEQAEVFGDIEIEKRLQQFDMEVKLERMRVRITGPRAAKNERYNNERFVATERGSVKRERSTSLESPAYEAVNDLSKNEAKKIRLHPIGDDSSSQYNNITDPLLHWLNQQKNEEKADTSATDHEINALLSKDSKYYTEIVYKLIVNIGRTFLIKGQTTGESAELLQRYARNISLLKIDSGLGAKRTTSLRELHQLHKLYELLDGFMAENNLNKGASVVRIKKEKLSLEEEFIFQLDSKAFNKGLSKGFVCCFCERPQNVVKCEKCLRHMHLVCLTADPLKQVGLQQLIEEKCFSCIECAAAGANGDLAKQPCFVCKDESEDATHEFKYRCTVRLCGRHYHLSCLRLFPQFALLNPQSIICPYHVCHTCVADDPRAKASTAKVTLVRCVRCPSAYHPDINCIPAGSEMLTMQQLICPKHSLEQVTLNVNWCFLCCKGGNLICCETCPNAFHRDCLPCTIPDGKYFCEECESGRLPLYNEIVVAKLGSFRWWPALIVPPSEISENLLQQRPSASSVCVKFFQSHTVAWLNRRRMYLYEHADSENLGAKKSGTLDKQYRIAMAEASKIYQLMQAMKTTEEARLAHKKKFNAPMYTKIRVNRYIAPLKQPPSSVDSSCYCCPGDDDPCGPTSSCINRAIMIECIPKTCPAKERCSNQRFAKRIYPSLEVRHFPDKGYGLVAKEAIKNGQFIIEYVGEVINAMEFKRRILSMQERKVENYYFLTVEPDMTIDAGPKGNTSRFINHACEPNCETQKWSLGNARVIGLFAIKDIKPGEELTFNYNLESVNNNKRVCLCGATKCSGFIGEKYRPPKEEPTRNSTKQVIKRVTKKVLHKATLNQKSNRNQNDTVPLIDENVEVVQLPEPVIIDLMVANPYVPSKPIHIKQEKID